MPTLQEMRKAMRYSPSFDPSRREFLRGMSAAALAALAAGEPRPVRGNEPITHPKTTADACIVLWMAGGMAAPENFDPKKYVPFEVGLPVEKVMSTFPAIDTAVDKIKIAAGGGKNFRGVGWGGGDWAPWVAGPGGKFVP